MATRIGYVQDGHGNKTLPKTSIKAVYDPDTGERLDHTLDNLIERAYTVVIDNAHKISYGTVEDLTTLNNYSNTLPNSTDYEVLLLCSASLPDIGTGGNFKVIGHKTTNDYEWQVLYSYAAQGIYVRQKSAGKWGNFTSYSTKLLSHRTMYIANTGNDNTGDGTLTNPYATLQRALRNIPDNLNGCNVNIYFADGDYNGADIRGKKNGWICFYKSGTGVVFFLTTMLINDSQVRLDGDFVFTPTNSNTTALRVSNNGYFITTTHCTYKGVYGIQVENGGNAALNSVQIFNNCNVAIRCSDAGSFVYVATAQGSGNTNGLQAINGGQIAYNDASGLSATTKFIYNSGGRIFPSSVGHGIIPVQTDPGAGSTAYSNYPWATLVVLYEG